MIAIDSLSFAQAEYLNVGQFARFADYDNALGLVGEMGQFRKQLILLDGWDREKNCYDLGEFYGRAIVYPKVTFEVDPESWRADCDVPGCLLAYQDQLMITVATPEYNTYATIQEGRTKVSQKHFFLRWRAVIHDSDRELLVFEQDASVPKTFSLEVPPELISSFVDQS